MKSSDSKLVEKSANQDNLEAQFNLGFMYSNGLEVPQNYLKAFEWYEKSANRHNATAQNNLGDLYRNGYGVSQDYNNACDLKIILKHWNGLKNLHYKVIQMHNMLLIEYI